MGMVIEKITEEQDSDLNITMYKRRVAFQGIRELVRRWKTYDLLLLSFGSFDIDPHCFCVGADI